MLVGDPAYYHRFGHNEPRLTLDAVPPEVFATAAGQDDLEGKVAFHPAFAATA